MRTQRKFDLATFERSYTVDPATGCHVWQGSKTHDGYGRMWFDGRFNIASRVAYEKFRAPVADRLEVDHLCRNRACVNPDHLEPVTRTENRRRAVAADPRWSTTHCRNGHERALNVTPSGYCRACNRLACARYHAKKALAT